MSLSMASLRKQRNSEADIRPGSPRLVKCDEPPKGSKDLQGLNFAFKCFIQLLIVCGALASNNYTALWLMFLPFYQFFSADVGVSTENDTIIISPEQTDDSPGESPESMPNLDPSPELQPKDEDSPASPSPCLILGESESHEIGDDVYPSDQEGPIQAIDAFPDEDPERNPNTAFVGSNCSELGDVCHHENEVANQEIEGLSVNVLITQSSDSEQKSLDEAEIELPNSNLLVSSTSELTTNNAEVQCKDEEAPPSYDAKPDTFNLYKHRGGNARDIVMCIHLLAWSFNGTLSLLRTLQLFYVLIRVYDFAFYQNRRKIVDITQLKAGDVIVFRRMLGYEHHALLSCIHPLTLTHYHSAEDGHFTRTRKNLTAIFDSKTGDAVTFIKKMFSYRFGTFLSDLLNDSVKLMRFLSPLNESKAEVSEEITTIEELTNAYQLIPEQDKCLSPKERLKNAQSEIGRGGYNVFTNNCQHFCQRCLYREPDHSKTYFLPVFFLTVPIIYISKKFEAISPFTVK